MSFKLITSSYLIITMKTGIFFAQNTCQFTLQYAFLLQNRDYKRGKISSCVSHAFTTTSRTFLDRRLIDGCLDIKLKHNCVTLLILFFMPWNVLATNSKLTVFLQYDHLRHFLIKPNAPLNCRWYDINNKSKIISSYDTISKYWYSIIYY